MSRSRESPEEEACEADGEGGRAYHAQAARDAGAAATSSRDGLDHGQSQPREAALNASDPSTAAPAIRLAALQQGDGLPERSSQHFLPKHVSAQSDAHNSPLRQAEGQVPSRAQQTPQPIEGTTPESLPSDGSQSAGSAEMRDMDLFQQLGPRHMQSLAAGVNGSVAASGQAAEGRDSDTTENGGVFQGQGSVSGHGYRQAKQSSAPTLPVVPEASAETGPGTAEDRRRVGALRRSLLPAVHPRFRSSPLRTPAVAQSLGALPDQAAGHEPGPGSPGARMGSTWNSSAKQGSLQHRLQQAARSQQGRLPAHASSGRLAERLQQKRNNTLPSRPSSKGKTPVLNSAHRAPMLNMQSVSAYQCCVLNDKLVSASCQDESLHRAWCCGAAREKACRLVHTHVSCHPDMCSDCAGADCVPGILGRTVQPRHERAAGVHAHARGRRPRAAGPRAIPEALLRILVQLWRRGPTRSAADNRACPHMMRKSASWTCIALH